MVSYNENGNEDKAKQHCLNPCCNGRWSRTLRLNVLFTLKVHSLNPCCNGRWSRTAITPHVKPMFQKVLILVVMEDGLVQNENGNEDKANNMS